MLVEFSVENFRSFKERVTFSMLASDDTIHEDTNVIILPDKTRLLKSAVIYGANASGKSNLILAMDFMSEFVFTARKMNPDEPINVIPFKLSKEHKEQPSRFEVIFFVNNVKYAYGFAVTNKEVVEEYLHIFNDGNEESQVMFSRDKSAKEEYTFANIEEPGVLRHLCQFTANNKLYLPIAVMLNYNKSDFTDIYDWLCKMHSYCAEEAHRILWKSCDKDASSDIERVCAEKAVKWVKGIDVGISDISIREIPDLLENSSPVGNGHRNGYSKILDNIISKHNVKSPDGTECSAEFDFYNEESRGTMNFFETALSVSERMFFGQLFIADELENSMHTLLAKYVVGLFHDTYNNPMNSQLIFTTHNTSLLDSDLYRRDQIWFTEKNPDTGATDIFSLYDYEIPEHAKDKEIDIEKGYLLGIYGAIPFIEGGSND